jgi:hypothetical protein
MITLILYFCQQSDFAKRFSTHSKWWWCSLSLLVKFGKQTCKLFYNIDYGKY